MIRDLFPQQTLVERPVPKKAFIDNLGASARMKDNFTREIERIEWLAKLAPSTINVVDGRNVHEIAVFLVTMKNQNRAENIFLFIDEMMPRHALFILRFEEKFCLLINFKEPLGQAEDSGKHYRIIKTFHTDWQTESFIHLPLSSGSMDNIYESYVRKVAGDCIISKDKDLKEAINQTAQRSALMNEIACLERRILSENQPNKKFELHKTLVELRKKL